MFSWAVLTPSGLSDPDTYWHIAAGRLIALSGSIPVGDPFSHSIPRAAWTAHEWLAELVLFAALRGGGWLGVQSVAAVCFALTIAYLTRFCLRRMEPVHAIMLVSVSIGLMSTHLLARPHVLVWPLTAWWIGSLIEAGESRRPPPWWLLVLLVCWVNMHASATLGIAIAGGLAVDALSHAWPSEAWWPLLKRWSIFMLLAALTLLVNPQGWHLLVYAVQVMRMKETLEMVAEWRSTDFHTLHVLLLWLLMVFGIALTGRLRLSLPRIAMLLGLTYLSLKHVRYHALLGLVSPFLLAEPMGETVRSFSRAVSSNAVDRVIQRLAAPASRAGGAGVVLLAALVLVAVQAWHPLAPKRAWTPTAAVDVAQSRGITGNVLNHYNFGGYLIFRGISVHVDGRSDMYGDAFMVEYGRALSAASPEVLDAQLAKYAIAWTLLPPETPAVNVLNTMPGWERLYADSIAVVHVRRGPVPAKTAMRP